MELFVVEVLLVVVVVIVVVDVAFGVSLDLMKGGVEADDTAENLEVLGLELVVELLGDVRVA